MNAALPALLLSIALSICAAQTASAQTTSCVDGGKIATEATFNDGSVVRVLERTNDTLRYEAQPPGKPATTMVVKKIFLTLSATTDKGANTFEWLSEPTMSGPLVEGQTHTASANLKTTVGTEAKITAEMTVGPLETVEVEGCAYPTRQLTVTLAMDGQKSKLVRNYHEKSMLTLKSVTYIFPTDTETKEVARTFAVSLK